MIQIPLRNRAGEVIAFAVISDADAPLAESNWYLHKKGYATRQQPGGGRNRKLMLHRVILNAPARVKVDHINRDTLDNRRENLRLASDAGNCQNRTLAKNNRSGFKGVRRDRGKWRAIIHTAGRWIHLGHYSKAEEAARAYDLAAIKFYGEFASPNFV